MQNHANTAAEFNMLCKNTQNERPQAEKNRSLGIQYYISRGNKRAAGAKFSGFGVIDLDF